MFGKLEALFHLLKGKLMTKEPEAVIDQEPVQIVVQHDFCTKIPGYRNFTLALSLPDPDSFLRAASDFVMGRKPAILMGVGISRVHPDDKPSRKKGREQALKAMRPKIVKVVSVVAGRAVNLDLSPVPGIHINLECMDGRLNVISMWCRKNDSLRFKREYEKATDEPEESIL